jgi:hypothetical protein
VTRRRAAPVPAPASAPAAPAQPAEAFEFVSTGILEDETVRVYRSHATGLLHVGPQGQHGPDRPAPSHLMQDTLTGGPVFQAGKAPIVATGGSDRITTLPTGGRVAVDSASGHSQPCLSCRVCGT